MDEYDSTIKPNSSATGKNEPGQGGHFARSFSEGDKLLFKGMSNQYKLPLHPFSPSGDYSKGKAVMHEGTHSAEVYADAAIKFSTDHATDDQPLFAYVSFQTPHDPRTSPPEFRAMYDDSNYAMITHTDAQIGRILETLEATGKQKEMIIVFAFMSWQ